MQNRFGRDFLLLVIGALGGWFGTKAAPTAPGLKPASPSESPVHAEVRPASADRPARADSLPSASADVTAPGEPASAKAISEDAVSTTMILAPARSDDTAKSESNAPADAVVRAEKARDDLEHAMMIRCDFKPGATGNWFNQKLNVSLFEWMGGPVTFEVVDLNAGTARMLGGDGATGSKEGVIDVLVTATSTGLHFSAFTPTRVLVVATVFSNMDASGMYRAVMSRHGTPTFFENISEQNYGNCDIGLTDAKPRNH